ncbi:MAG: endonuclease/exonuclease/phosphatase family protein [Planctomycetota bacterium]|nr:endonuclease/exonuclease/phosphatase family protein [Planctomycetota bacterium]
MRLRSISHRSVSTAFSVLFGCLSLACMRSPGDVARVQAAEPVESEPDSSAEATSEEPGADATLRAATFNIRYAAARERDARDQWTRRRGHVLETIEALDLDVLCVQEALHAQMRFLRGGLEGYAAVGQGREGGKRGEYAAIFYRTDRFRELDHGSFWLSETPEKTASVGWDAALTRMVTWVELEDRATGRAFRAWCTHFDHRGEIARLRSAELLGARVAASALPDLVLGDLNAGESTPVLAALAAEGLRDTFRDAHPGATEVGTFGGWVGRTGGAKIDHVLADDGFETVAASIDRRQFDGRDPSDHFPVLAVVRFRGE